MKAIGWQTLHQHPDIEAGRRANGRSAWLLEADLAAHYDCPPSPSIRLWPAVEGRGLIEGHAEPRFCSAVGSSPAVPRTTISGEAIPARMARPAHSARSETDKSEQPLLVHRCSISSGSPFFAVRTSHRRAVSPTRQLFPMPPKSTSQTTTSAAWLASPSNAEHRTVLETPRRCCAPVSISDSRSSLPSMVQDRAGPVLSPAAASLTGMHVRRPFQPVSPLAWKRAQCS